MLLEWKKGPKCDGGEMVLQRDACLSVRGKGPARWIDAHKWYGEQLGVPELFRVPVRSSYIES